MGHPHWIGGPMHTQETKDAQVIGWTATHSPRSWASVAAARSAAATPRRPGRARLHGARQHPVAGAVGGLEDQRFGLTYSTTVSLFTWDAQVLWQVSTDGRVTATFTCRTAIWSSTTATGADLVLWQRRSPAHISASRTTATWSSTTQRHALWATNTNWY
jgi:hypothetical protein